MRYKKATAFRGLGILCLAVFCLALAQNPAQATAQAPEPDYSQAKNWLALPAQPAKKVDVFWVYPTVHTGEQVIADIDNPQMRAGAEETLVAQASVFAESANIFAPLYRQANISVLSLPAAEKEQKLGIGLADVQAAFDYYLKNLNNGRPFILAGHSQGSNLLLNFMKARLSDAGLAQSMIAAYVIGWSVTKDDLEQYPFLAICGDAQQTGCVITYNSVAAGAQKSAPTIQPGAISVNPLSWSTDGEMAPARENLGAVFFDDKGQSRTIAHFTSAQNVDGGLVTAPADTSFLQDLPFGPGVYHNYDYSLFYLNLKANLAQRIDAFMRNQ